MRSTRIACLAVLLGLSALVDKTLLFIDKLPWFKSTSTITNKEVLAAQKGWGDALVKISKTYEDEGFEAAKALSETIIDAAYGYNYGPVLFKPTLAGGSQTFRTTKKGALAYFVGGDKEYPNDKGFGIKGWRKVVFVNSAIWKEGNLALVQGNVYFTDKTGAVTIVDKTFGFLKAPDGNLVIALHHSSLPYSASAAAITDEEVLAAQKGWGDALVKISKTYEDEGFAAAKALSATIIDAAYGYKYRPVLFKPTLAGGSQTFRTTKKGALAYFVGGDKAYPNDKGFGIKGWRKVVFVNSAIWKEGDLALVQGNVIFTDKDGGVTTVDKTFGFFRGPDGKLVIALHHSSLPYSA